MESRNSKSEVKDGTIPKMEYLIPNYNEFDEVVDAYFNLSASIIGRRGMIMKDYPVRMFRVIEI